MKNEPAFPGAYTYPYVDETVKDYMPGMTLRQWYKGQAAGRIAAALMARNNEPGYTELEAMYEATRLSAQIADALLAEDAEHGKGESHE